MKMKLKIKCMSIMTKTINYKGMIIMEDKELKRKQRNHNIYKLIKMIILTPIIFCIINIALNYFVISFNYDFENPAKDFWDFKLRYIYGETTFMPSYLILAISWGISALIVVRMDLRWQIKNGSKNLKSDDRWINEKEIKNNFKKINLKNIENYDDAGILMYADNKNEVYVDTENIHSLVIGSTRSGKGQLIILPLIWMISAVKNKQSFITNDMKGDNLESTYEILKDNDYEIIVINLDDATRSDEWDLLYEAKKEYVKAIKFEDPDLSRCTKILDSIASLFTDDPTSQPVWPNSAHALLVAMMLYMIEEGYKNNKLEKVTMPSVYQFFVTYGSYDKVVNNVKINALDEIFRKLPVGNPAKAEYASSNFAKGEMRGSIFSLLASDLKIFSIDNGVQKITSGNTVDFSKISSTDKPCAVFLILPDEDRSRDIIASAFINQCYDYLAKQSKKYPRKMLQRRVQFILDEFANMPRIPAMDNKVSIGAGHNIIFTLVIQSLNAMDEKYGKLARSIRGTIGNVIYINSIDSDTNKFISSGLGNPQYDIASYSGDLHDLMKHKSISHETKPLMSATQLGRLKKGKVVITRQRSYPILAELEPFYKYGFPVVSIDDIPIHKITRSMKDCFYPIEDFQSSINMKVVDNEDNQINYFNNDIEYINTDNYNNGSSALNELENKINNLSKGQYYKALQNQDFQAAENIVKSQATFKHISKEESELLLSELSQYY